MKNNKILAMLLAAGLAVGCLAGCGQQAQTNKTSEVASGSKVEEAGSSSVVEEEPSLFNEPGTLPIVNEPITLKVLMCDEQNAHQSTVLDSKMWDWLAEQTGVNFEVECYSQTDLATKLPLIMAGDDLPDLFIRCNFTYGDLEGYANAGKIISLNDLTDEYGYYTKQVMEERADAAGSFYASDGNCYALPRITAAKAAGRLSYGVNQDWLDNLGLEVPTTWDDLYDVLVAFKEKDANGNGDPDDEIPWCILGNSMGQVICENAFAGIATYWPISGAMFDDNDGEVFLANTSDEYRELLRFMSKCYAEGLLNKDAYTQTSAEYNALVEADRIGVTHRVGLSDFTAKECGKVLTYTGVVLDGEVLGRGASFNPNLFSVSGTTEYPEICFMIGDFLYSEEASWLSNYGVPGEAFNWQDEANFQFKTESGQKNEYYLFANCYIRDEWAQNATDEVVADYQLKTDKVSKTAFQNYLVYTAEETEQISVIGTDIGSVLDEYKVHFVTGQKDIEKDWDEYVALIESMGAEELTVIYQAAYDRFYN